MDDGAHAVNVEEIRQEEKQQSAAFYNAAHHGANAAQGLANHGAFRLDGVHLMHMPPHGNGEHQPPHGSNHKGNLAGQVGGHAEGFPEENQNQRDHQGNRAAADVSQAIAVGGYGVHAVVGGHVGEEAVVEHAAAVKADGAEDVQHQHQLPVGSEAKRRGGRDAQQCKGGEQPLFISAVIAQGAEDGGKQRTNQCGDAGGISPPWAGLGDALGDGGIEVGEDDGRNDGGEG